MAIFLIGLWCLSSGLTDIDWMINTYYWPLTDNGHIGGQWAFSTHFKLEWWLAYQITVLRIIAGTAILTAFAALFVHEVRKA